MPTHDRAKNKFNRIDANKNHLEKPCPVERARVVVELPPKSIMGVYINPECVRQYMLNLCLSPVGPGERSKCSLQIGPTLTLGHRHAAWWCGAKLQM